MLALLRAATEAWQGQGQGVGTGNGTVAHLQIDQYFEELGRAYNLGELLIRFDLIEECCKYLILRQHIQHADQQSVQSVELRLRLVGLLYRCELCRERERKSKSGRERERSVNNWQNI